MIKYCNQCYELVEYRLVRFLLRLYPNAVTCNIEGCKYHGKDWLDKEGII